MFLYLTIRASEIKSLNISNKTGLAKKYKGLASFKELIKWKSFSVMSTKQMEQPLNKGIYIYQSLGYLHG